MMKFLPAETLCAGVAILAYVNTFGADFVYDDSRAILSNLDVRTSTPLRNIFFNDFWGTPMTHSGSHKSYRPVTTLTFRLNYAISGFRPWSYHVFNVLLHSLATWLFASFTRKRIFTGQSARKAIAAGLLFAVHPIHTEAVAGVVGRADVLSAVFVLACLANYENFCGQFESPTSDVSKDGLGYSPGMTNCTGGGHGECVTQVSKRRRKNKTPKITSRRSAPKQEHDVTSRSVGRCQQNTNSDCDCSRVNACQDQEFFPQSESKIRSPWLLFVFAACAAFSKETGFCALPLCAIYDVCVRNKLGFFGARKALLLGGSSSRCNHLRRRFWTLVMGTIALFCARILPWKMLSPGPISPSFSSADNPASFSESFLTRTFTFNYLISFNALLLAFPTTLSYDWGGMPLVESIWDLRNLCTLIFYTTVGLSLRSIWKRRAKTDTARCGKLYAVTRKNGGKTPNRSFEHSAEVREKLRNFRQTKDQTKDFGIMQQSETATPNMIVKTLSSKAINRAAFLAADEGICLDASNFQTSDSAACFVSSTRGSVQDVLAPLRGVDHELTGKSLTNFEVPDSTNSSGYATEGSDEGHDDKGRHECRNEVTEQLAGYSNDNSVQKVITLDEHINRKTGVILMAIAMIIVPLVPSTNLFFYVGFVAAERLLYFPSAGYCIFVSLGWFKMREMTVCVCISKKRREKVLKLMTSFGWIILVSLFVRTAIRNHDWKDELHLYRSGIRTSPAKSWSNLGNVMKQSGRTNEAETCYLNALKERGNMADVHYNLGLLYQEQKRNGEALARYQMAILYRPTLAVAYLNSGIVLAELGKAVEAEKMYRHAVQIDDTGLKNPRAHAKAKISALYNLGCLLSSQSRHGQAVVSFKEAVSRLTPDYEPHSLYNMLGQSLFKLKKLHEAEKWFEAALKSKPDHIPAHLTYALLLRETGRPDDAEKTYTRAMEIAPDNHVIYSHFAKSQSDQERFTDAALLMDKAAATKSGSTDYGTLMSAGDAYRRLVDYEKAESYYTKATEINPQAAAAFINLGATLHLRGRYREARENYEKALLLSPGASVATQNLHKLDDFLKSENERLP